MAWVRDRFESRYPAHLRIWYSCPQPYDIKDDLPKTVIDPLGYKSEQTYDDRGNLLKSRTQLNSTEWAETRYTYADVTVGLTTIKGALTQQKSLVGGTWTNGVLTNDTWATTDISGYNVSGQAGTTTLPGVKLQEGGSDQSLVTTQTFDAFGNVLTKTDTAGTTVQTNTYNLAGQVLKSTGPPLTAEGGSAQVETNVFYDAWGRVTESYKTSTAETGTKTGWTTSTYDKCGRASVVTTKLTDGTVQSATTNTYDGLGRSISVHTSTVSGKDALNVYDARGSVIAAWAAGACTEAEGYVLAKASRATYDDIGRKVTTTAPASDDTHFYYTDDNHATDDIWLHKQVNPDGTWAESTYDDLGRVIATVTSTNANTAATYDRGGRVVSSTNANGFATSSTYDFLGRQLTVGAATKPSSEFVYNTLGWKLKIQDADTFTTTYVFDTAGRVVSETTADHTTETSYDSAGLVLDRTESAENRVTSFAYDNFGRAVNETQTVGSTPVKDNAVTYDSLGRPTSSTDSIRNLTTVATYPVNTPGNTVSVAGIGPTGDQVATTINVAADGLETTRASTITGGTALVRAVTTRDNAKRVTASTLDTDADSASEIDSGYAYDTAGHLKRQWGTGYASGASSTDAYTYSGTSGLKTADNLQLASVGTAGTISGAYTYTDAGRLDTATVNGVTETYTFDPAGNLTSLGTGTSLVYQDNRLASMTAGGITNYFAFDAGKRWRTAQAPSADAEGVLADPNRTTFAYTGTGRLSDYLKYTAGNETAHGVYTYDSVGQRTKSVVTLGGQETTTDFTYTGLTLHKLSATQTGGTATASWSITYLYDEYGKPYAGVYRDTTSTEPPPAPVVFGMITTDRGDVVELLDKDGEPFAAYRYDAWGNPLGAGTDGATGMWWKTTTSITDVNVAKAIAQRQVLRYAGYCYDSESGMYYLSARHYDPATRQFLSKDLSRNDGEQSAYQYCLGNPVGNVDPTGLFGMSLQLRIQLMRQRLFGSLAQMFPAFGRQVNAVNRNAQALRKGDLSCMDPSGRKLLRKNGAVAVDLRTGRTLSGTRGTPSWSIGLVGKGVVVQAPETWAVGQAQKGFNDQPEDRVVRVATNSRLQSDGSPTWQTVEIPNPHKWTVGGVVGDGRAAARLAWYTLNGSKDYLFELCLGDAKAAQDRFNESAERGVKNVEELLDDD
jgi:RHS repeat-associated protein